MVVLTVGFGWATGGAVDNAAHLGGLAAGLWLGALLPPTGVPTLSSLWHRPAVAGTDATSGLPATNGRPVALGTPVAGKTTAPGYLLLIALAVIAIAVVAGISVGTSARLG
jgi:hypothetical protein